MANWKISTEGASKTKVLSFRGEPIARFYAGRDDANFLARIEAALENGFLAARCPHDPQPMTTQPITAASGEEGMSIVEACYSILGDEKASQMLAEMGIYWCVVVAMAVATTAHDPRAIARIREWNDEQRALK